MSAELLTQIDGVGSATESRLVVVGATNHPERLDDAFVSRCLGRIQYIGLPNSAQRRAMVMLQLAELPHKVPWRAVNLFVIRSRGYSGRDIAGIGAASLLSQGHTGCGDTVHSGLGKMFDDQSLQYYSAVEAGTADWVTPPLTGRVLLQTLRTTPSSVNHKEVARLREWGRAREQTNQVVQVKGEGQ